MRAILIDPKEHTVTEVEYTGDYKNINEHIGADLFDCVRINQSDTIFVDDEGLINGKINTGGMFRFDGDYPAYLAGKALILGTDNSGESVATDLDIEWVKSKVAFGSPTRMGSLIVFIEHDKIGEGTGRFWPITN